MNVDFYLNEHRSGTVVTLDDNIYHGVILVVYFRRRHDGLDINQNYCCIIHDRSIINDTVRTFHKRNEFYDRSNPSNPWTIRDRSYFVRSPVSVGLNV